MTLTPVTELYQLTPNLSKLDQTGAVNSQNVDNVKSSNASSTLQPIDVINKRRETERSLAIRQNSYAYLKQKADAEPWIDLRLLQQMSSTSLELLKLLSFGDAQQNKQRENILAKKRSKNVSSDDEEDTSSDDQDMDVKQMSDDQQGDAINSVEPLRLKDYLALIAPEQADYLKDEESTITSTHMPLTKQIKDYLCANVMIKFDDLTNFSPQAAKKKKDSLKYLQDHAVLVRGIWVVKSALFFNSRFGTEEALGDEKTNALELLVKLQQTPKTLLQQGAEPFPWQNMADQMLRRCALRDIVLALFCAAKEGAIKRADVQKLVRIQTQELREVLTGLSVPNKATKMWHLKLQEDAKFNKQNSKIVKLEIERWKLRKFRALVALGMPPEEASKHVT